MLQSPTTAVYFVASPLQYLAARQISQQFEKGSRQVLLWYKPGLRTVVRPEEWDACAYLPWPRIEPLPGLLGSHKRLQDNIRLVSELVGPSERIILHSAVFDTEAVNYFIHALRIRCRAQSVHARILPDGLLSIRRYPLTPVKRALQQLRRIRGWFAPELQYSRFAGDRIGSDASFCDRIYVLPDLPHQYPPEKTCLLANLVTRTEWNPVKGDGKRALVIGQPLLGTGLLSEAALRRVTSQIHDWLRARGMTVYYKPHPKDLHHELRHESYTMLETNKPLELHMTETWYDAVVGVRSSALLLARQLYPADVEVVAFGWKDIRFKSADEGRDMQNVFKQAGVRIDPGP